MSRHHPPLVCVNGQDECHSGVLRHPDNAYSVEAPFRQDSLVDAASSTHNGRLEEKDAMVFIAMASEWGVAGPTLHITVDECSIGPKLRYSPFPGDHSIRAASRIAFYSDNLKGVSSINYNL